MPVRASDQITLQRLVDLSYFRTFYLLQDSTLSAPTTPTTNPPAAPWSETEPTYVAGSTKTLYTVPLSVYSNGAFSYGAVSKSTSYEGVKDAVNQSAAAAGTASSALTAANGRNRIVRQTTDATNPSAYQQGDMWWKYSGSAISDMWIHDGSAWVKQTMAGTTLSSLNAGNITTGSMNGSFVTAGTISVSKLLVTSIDNLINDPGFEYTGSTNQGWAFTTPTARTTTTPRTMSNALSLPTQAAAYAAARQVPNISIIDGEKYRVSFWVRRSAGVSGANPIAARLQLGTTETFTSSATVLPDIPLSYVGTTPPSGYTGVGTTYVQVWGIVTIPAGTNASNKFAKFEFIVREAGAGVTYTVDDVEMKKMEDGQLIVDGSIKAPLIDSDAIQTRHVGANTITVDKLDAGVGGQLNLEANNSIIFNVGVANEALAQAGAAQNLAGSAQSKADNALAQASDMASVYRFTPEGAFIQKPGDRYSLSLTNQGVSILDGDVAVSYWDAGRMVVSSFIGEELILVNHKMEASGDGTVFRSL